MNLWPLPRAVADAELRSEYRAPGVWFLGCAYLLLAGYIFAALVVVPQQNQLVPLFTGLLVPTMLLGGVVAASGTTGELRDGTYEVLVSHGVGPLRFVLSRLVVTVTVVASVVAVPAILFPIFVAAHGDTSWREVAALWATLGLAVVLGTGGGLLVGTIVRRAWMAAVVAAGWTLGLWVAGAGDAIGNSWSWVSWISPRPRLTRMAAGFLSAEDVAGLLITVVLVGGGAVAALDFQRGAGPARELIRRLTRPVILTGGLVALLAVVALFGLQVDLSRAAAFTLGPEAKSAVETLSAPTRLIGLYERGQSGRLEAQQLLAAYAASSSKVRSSIGSPVKLSSLAQEVGAEDGGVVVVARDDRRAVVSPVDEGGVAAALRRIEEGPKAQLCFTTGHGEVDLDEPNHPRGAARLARLLEQEGYGVVPLLELPPDPSCQAVVVFGPARQISPSEQADLLSYVDNGGRLLIFAEPGSTPFLAEVLGRPGFSLAPGVVVDPAQRVSPDAAAVLAFDPRSGASGRPVTLQTATAVAGPPEAVPLLGTPPDAWLENGNQLEPTFDSKEDQRGPISLGMAVRHPSGAGYAVSVVGDSDLARNAWLTGENRAWMRHIVAQALRGEEAAPTGDRPTPAEVLRLADGQRPMAVGMTVVLPALALAGIGGSRLAGWRSGTPLAIAAALLALAGLGSWLLLGRSGTAGSSVAWGSLTARISPPARLVSFSPDVLEIGVGDERLAASVQVVAGPLDVERLVSLNGGRITNRASARVGGVRATSITSTNSSGYEFRDFEVADEGVYVLSRWSPGRRGEVEDILRRLVFRGRYMVDSPLSELFAAGGSSDADNTLGFVRLLG